jgi:hypothetical protein
MSGGTSEKEVLFIRSGLLSPLLMYFVREDDLPCDVFPVQGGYRIHVREPAQDARRHPPELAELFAIARAQGKRWLHLEEGQATAAGSAVNRHH